MATKQAPARKKSTTRITAEEASRVIKRQAAKQRIRVELPPEALDALAKNWDPNRPAEVQFFVRRKLVADLKVAICAYWSDTCCASPVDPRSRTRRPVSPKRKK